VSDDIYITHVARLPHTQSLRVLSLSLSLFNDLVARERERERESLRKKKARREKENDACRIRKMRKEVYESNRIALTFLPPPEPDIFGGERGGVGGGEGREREREISKPLSFLLSFLLSLSLSLSAPCVLRRAFEYDFLVKVFLVSHFARGKILHKKFR